MIKKILQYLKEQIKLKDILIWFVLSFIGVFLVFAFVMKQTIDGILLIETLSFAIIFVIMMIGTKAYGCFVDDFYQDRIDEHERKYGNRK